MEVILKHKFSEWSQTHYEYIITGDITQIDLPHKNMSGLIEALNILDKINGISIVKFNNSDVMRHPLVSKIIEKYEEYYD